MTECRPRQARERTLSAPLPGTETLAAAVGAGSGEVALCGHCNGIVTDGTEHAPTTFGGQRACLVVKKPLDPQPG